jgi:hypothetical protein
MNFRKFISLVPTELALSISRDLNIGDIDSISTALDTCKLDDISWTRKDPHTYLRSLVEDTQLLRKRMWETDTLLSGSRGAGFFYPDAYTDSSDWDFLCHTHKVVEFAVGLMRMGAVWQTSELGSVPCYGSMSVLKGELNGFKVQLIFKRSGTPLDIVCGFHSSLVQCFISGVAAVSMYHDISKRGISIKWDNNGNVTNAKSSHTWQEKYISRGFKVESPLEVDANVFPGGIGLNFCTRVVSDPGSLVLDFKEYTDFGKENNIAIQVDIEQTRRIRWREIVGVSRRGPTLVTTQDSEGPFVVGEMFPITRIVGGRSPPFTERVIEQVRPPVWVSASEEIEKDCVIWLVDGTMIPAPWLNNLPETWRIGLYS